MKALDPKGEGFLDDKVAFTPYSIVNDAFDIRGFEEIKEHSTKLLKTEELGKKEYDQFSELQQDIFDSLYKYDPELREEWEMKREFLLNKKIAEELMQKPQYKELRVLTSLDIVNSAVGVELMAGETLELIKKMKEERKALEELIDAGNALDAVGKGANGANGTAISDPNAMTLEEAKELYEQAMEKFQEATSRQEFKQNIERLTSKIKDGVKETSDLISNWGLGASGGFSRKPPHEKMELLNRLRKGKLAQIAKLAGRQRRLHQLQKQERVKQGLEDQHSIQQGNHLDRLVTSEWLKLLNPLTRTQFLSDLIEGKTLEYQIRGKQRKGKGPIIVCIDSSGSMDGMPEIWAKAVALILLEIAKDQKRDFYCIHFSSGYRELHTNEFLKTEPFDVEKLIDMAEYFEAGGTEFEPALNLSRQKIGADKLYQKADIIFITDGQSAVKDAWLAEFKKWKTENKVKVYSVLIDSYDNSNSTLNQFSDRVDKLSNLRETQDDLALSIFAEM